MIAYRLQMPVLNKLRRWLQYMPRLPNKIMETPLTPRPNRRYAPVNVPTPTILVTPPQSLPNLRLRNPRR